MSSPVGTTIKTQIMGLINNFGITSKHKIDSINREVSVVLTQTPDLIITSPSTTDKFDYIIHYVENGEDKTSLPRPYEDGFTLTEKCDSNSNIFVEVIDRGTNEKYISNTIVVPENGFLDQNTKTYTLVDGKTFNSILRNYLPESGRYRSSLYITDEKMPETGIFPIEGLDADNDGGIVAWYKIKHIENDPLFNKSIDEYHFYISTQRLGQKVIANNDCSEMFLDGKYGFLDLGMLDVSNTTNMSLMFNNLYNNFLEGIEMKGLEKWDTSKVTNMHGMFHTFGLMSKYIKMDLSNFNTSNVTDMSNMFTRMAINGVDYIELGDISNWDVRKVESTNSMFVNGLSVKQRFVIDFSNWELKSLKDGWGTFAFMQNQGKNITIKLPKYINESANTEYFITDTWYDETDNYKLYSENNLPIGFTTSHTLVKNKPN